MTEELKNAILSLPYFSGKNITLDSSLFMYHVKHDFYSFMFLIKPTDDGQKECCYSIFVSEEGIIKMDINESKIILRNASDDMDSTYDLTAYDSVVHCETGSVLPYEIVEVLHEMNKLIDASFSA